MIFQHHIAKITTSATVYGRAGCITFYQQQYWQYCAEYPFPQPAEWTCPQPAVSTCRVSPLPPPAVWMLRDQCPDFYTGRFFILKPSWKCSFLKRGFSLRDNCWSDQNRSADRNWCKKWKQRNISYPSSTVAQQLYYGIQKHMLQKMGEGGVVCKLRDGGN